MSLGSNIVVALNALSETDKRDMDKIWEAIGSEIETGVLDWNSAITYSINDFVSYIGIIYKSLQNNNLNKQPDTETAWWEEYGVGGDFLPLIGGTLTGDLTLASGVDILHSGTNVDKYIYFASDAYIRWIEANDEFWFPKRVRIANSYLWNDNLELNIYGSGVRNAYIDFHNADSPADYTARIFNPGGNPDLDFIINAAGVFTFNKTIQIESGGLNTPAGDITVGAITRAVNSFLRVLSDDSHIAGFEAYGNNQGTGYCFVGQSSQYGGGIFYNGDGSPAFATGETADYISFYRMTAGVRHVVFDCSHANGIVRFKSGFNILAGSTIGKITVSTAAPSGGADNDIWLVREA